MVIDTSAIVAIFLGEPERTIFLGSIRNAETRFVSAATVLEIGIVLESRLGESASREFDLFLVRMKIETIPMDAEQAEVARSAWRKYGKGRHAAGLNFRDCFVYALAKCFDEPILAKGEDFKQTDAEYAC
jgi:ribonuclease VapC